MQINPSDLKIEFLKGTGGGGQRKNKVETACRITHLPTGVVGFADTRRQSQSRKEAMAIVEESLAEQARLRAAAAKKAARDLKVQSPDDLIRTYNMSRGMVKDHRTGKTASIKDILTKSKLHLLQ